MWLFEAPWADGEPKTLASLKQVPSSPHTDQGAPSRGTSPISDRGSDRSDVSGEGFDKLRGVRSVHEWLERVKRGYSRFTVAFEALGVEDASDIRNIDRTIFEQVETLLRDGCAAKSMHLKNIRLALLELGCNLRTPSEDIAAAEGHPYLALADSAAKGRNVAAGNGSSTPPRRMATARPLREAAGSIGGEQHEHKLHTATTAAADAAAATPTPAPPVPPPPRPLMRQSDSGLARAQQWEEVVSAMAAQASAGGLWNKLAKGIETEGELRDFFRRRQASEKGGKHLQIASAVKVVNNASLQSFAATRHLHVHPMKAHRSGDTFLFHGCPQESATNIQADGLKIGYASSGMLGRGLYGAPDPRKSLQYCKDSPHGKFMFVCRFNLREAKHAGPSTAHRNSIFDEFCIYDEKHVVLLWMIKLAPR